MRGLMNNLRRRSNAASRFLLAAFMVLTLVTTALPAGAEPPAPEDGGEPQLEAPLNPQFLAYLEEPPEVSYGYVPPPVDLSHLDELAVQEVEPAALPSHFDWRDEGKVTSVKNQNPCGTCWAFGTTSVLESAVLIGESAAPEPDFSEQSVALCVDRSWEYLYDDPDDPCMGGGWSWLASEVFIKKGAVLEACNPYDTSALECDGGCVCDSCPSVKSVDGYRLVTDDGSQIDTIKNAVYNEGPVTVVFQYESAYEYEDPTWGTIYDYYPNPDETNHCTSIVGWDDDVPHPNPSHGGTGAWIVKNSWGTGWGDNGYFYLTYDSSHAREVAYLHYKDPDPGEELLYWDEAGYIVGRGFGDETAWMASVFTAPQDKALTHVDFWTTSSNAEYEIYVWNGEFGSQLAHQTGSCQEWGYYSIPLGTPISMPAGQEFTVGVKMTTPGYNYPIPIEKAISGKVDPPIQSDVSFIRHTAGNSWSDLASVDRNACLRARMTEVENAPPNTPSNPSPADGATDVSTDVDLSWTGGDPDAGDTVTYDVYLEANDSTPDDLICDDVSTPTCDPGALAYDTQYSWYVVATDDHDASMEGDVWDFTTGTEPNDPPNTPSNPSPADGATDVSTDADLSWTGGDPDPGDTVTYDVYLEANDSTPDDLVCDDVSTPTCDPGALAYDTPYYWYVVATDNRGGSTTGDTWDFTTALGPGARTWNGSISSDWHTAGNWTPAAVPTSGDDVTIPDVANDPIISSGDAAVDDLTIESGAVLDLTDRALTVEGTLTNDGTLKQTRGVAEGSSTNFLRITNLAGTQTKYYGVDITPSNIVGSASLAKVERFRQGTIPTAQVGEDVDRQERPAKGHPKLESSLAQLADARRSGGLSDATDFAEIHGIALDDGRVQVVIEATGETIGDLREAVEALGGEYQTHYETLLQALVPIDALEMLAERSDVQFVREPRRPIPATPLKAGTVDSEGLVPSNASAWHAAGYTGSGVRVAVIALGFTGYDSLLGSDLPPSVNTYDWTGEGDMGGSEEGTACAEIVYDMAPGATIDLHRISTWVELGNAVDQAIDDGVDIVSMSLGSLLDGPGDGTGPVADIINNARSNGILFATAAGNNAEHSWSGLYHESGYYNHLWTAEQSVNYFGPGDGDYWLIPEGYPLTVALHWDDWTVVNQDYDLVLYYWDGDSWEYVAESSNLQDGTAGQTPEEFISVEAPVEAPYGVIVWRYSASRDVCLRLNALHAGPDLDERVPERSVMFPGDSPDAITVGAADVSAPYPLEPYSSRGPTFGAGGACSGGSIKPDIAAYANVSTVSYGTEGFAGTSAATPHVAGAAALVKEAYPSYTVSQLQDYLEDNAIDRGDPGKDNLYGAGRLYLADAPAPANNPPYEPSAPSPADGATEVSTEADLSWTGGDPDSGDTVTYDVYFEADDSTPDELLCDDASTPTCDPGTLAYDTHYYWKVIARDEHEETTTGPLWDFTTGSEPNNPPNQPSNPSPADGATNQDLNVDLSWTGGDPDSGDTVTYDVYFEADDSTPDELLCDDVTTTSCDPGTLDAGTDYYWYVVATDNHAASTEGDIWDFTTESPNTPPTISGLPDQELPMNGSADDVIDLWAYANDAEDGDDELTFTISNAPAPGAGVTIDANRHIDINPAAGWVGTTEVEIQVEDTGGLTDSDSFQVSVVGTNVTVSVSGNQFCAGRTTGVERCFDVAPEAQMDATVRFYFREAERNGLALEDLLVFHYTDEWTEEPGPYVRGGAGDAQYVEAQNVDDFSPFALDSAAVPNRPPHQPDNPTPADGATEVSTAIDLSWTGGDPDPGDTVTYDVYFEADDSAPDELLCDDVTTTSCDPGTLDAGTDYYWYVIATDSHAASTEGEVWDFTTAPDNTPPTISGLPDQELSMNGSADNAIDLWVHADDAEDADADLTFTISNSPSAGAGVSIDADRYVDINPVTGWAGTTEVEIQVEDSGGLTDTDSFQVTITNSPPTISGLPDQELSMNGSVDDAIDLWAYTHDAEDASADLAFTISNSPAAGAGVTIDADRYVDVNPLTDWTGTTEVEIQVEDTGGLTDSDTFRVTVRAHIVHLPLLAKRYPPIPDVPVLNAISNPDGDGNYTVSWNAAYLANTYVLQEDDNAAFSSPTIRHSAAGTSWNATGKAPGTYYYRVKARNAWGDSGWSNVESVTVVPPTNPPYQPGNPTPADGATNQDLNVDLSWTGGDPDPGDTVTYDVYFEAGDSTPEELICDGVSTTFCDPGTLEQAGHYYWYVEARDNHGATATSETWDFYTVCPDFRTGQWAGAADFTVPSDRSRVLDFSIDINCPNCFRGELTADELPIQGCQISFAATDGGTQVSGSGRFVSETDMRGSFFVLRSSCVCSGSWRSWWVSSSQQSDAPNNFSPVNGTAQNSSVVVGSWQGMMPE